MRIETSDDGSCKRLELDESEIQAAGKSRIEAIKILRFLITSRGPCTFQGDLTKSTPLGLKSAKELVEAIMSIQPYVPPVEASQLEEAKRQNVEAQNQCFDNGWEVGYEEGQEAVYAKVGRLLLDPK